MKQQHMSARVIIPMPHEMTQTIDDFRYEARIPSRAEAMRQLMQRQIEMEKVLGKLMDEIERYREQAHLSSRQEAIAHLVAAGLKHAADVQNEKAL